jgi:hypothetical protein
MGGAVPRGAHVSPQRRARDLNLRVDVAPSTLRPPVQIADLKNLWFDACLKRARSLAAGTSSQASYTKPQR